MLPNQPRVLFIERLTGSSLCAHPADREEQKRDEDESAWHRAIVAVASAEGCGETRRPSTLLRTAMSFVEWPKHTRAQKRSSRQNEDMFSGR